MRDFCNQSSKRNSTTSSPPPPPPPRKKNKANTILNAPKEIKFPFSFSASSNECTFYFSD